jgi:hypothetical protein
LQPSLQHLTDAVTTRRCCWLRRSAALRPEPATTRGLSRRLLLLEYALLLQYLRHPFRKHLGEVCGYGLWRAL